MSTSGAEGTTACGSPPLPPRVRLSGGGTNEGKTSGCGRETERTRSDLMVGENLSNGYERELRVAGAPVEVGVQRSTFDVQSSTVSLLARA